MPLMRTARAALGLLLASTATAAAQATPPEEPAQPVRGLVRALAQAMISTELQTRVATVALKEGEAFRKGDVLVEFDCRRQRAELAAADAQLQEMKLQLQNNKVLRQAQAVGRHDVDISEARVDKAKAEAEAQRVRLDQCSVVAPFDGAVLDLAIQPHETPQPGKPFIGLIARGALEIDIIAPAGWLRTLGIGSPLAFVVDETATRHRIVVRRIGAAVEPLSQTVKFVAAFEGPAASVLPGMSGTAEPVRHD